MKAIRPPSPRNALLLLGCALLTTPALMAQTNYPDWAAGFGLSGANASPGADPDGDLIINSAEYALGSNPTVRDNPDDLHPVYQFAGGVAEFEYRRGKASAGNVEYILQRSENLKDWYVPLIDLYPAQDPGGDYVLQAGAVDVSNSNSSYFRLLARVNVAGGGLGGPSPVVIPLGDPISMVWEGLDAVTPTIRTVAPDVNDPSQDPPANPNTTKYPSVAGAERLSLTTVDQGSRVDRNPVNWRSWLGWFALGDGVPPPGVSPGYPITVEKDAGSYLFNDSNWDYYAWKFPQGGNFEDGEMRAVRVDQQPLYLNPWRINYQFPVGAFGWKKQPMQPFRTTKLDYWADKKIVRGINLSLAYPFLHQKGDFVTTNPEAWQQQPLFIRTRPIETLVVVPSNLDPETLNSNGAWNRRSTGPEVGQNEPFPYPVWSKTASPEEQTPYNLKIDRIGDFDVEFVWEGTNPDYDMDYNANRYRYTDFGQEGIGDYLKMTASQGSPFIWCEAHNSRFMIFYNMIRTNMKGNIDNYNLDEYTGRDAQMQPQYETVGNTGAKFIEGNDIPGVPGVKYVLAYGNQMNPNQFYQEVEPILWDIPTGRVGGWNPPGSVSNHTYIAIFYKEDTVKPVNALSDVTGEDADNNRYFYLEFNNPEAKNWFVVGAIPVMRYYDPNTSEDTEAAREAAAHAWAQQLGRYAFNFSTGTEIDYNVTNIYQVDTTFSHTLRNPFIETGAPGGAQTVAEAGKTVINLLPHQYQPFNLGPNLTTADPDDQVTWQPLRTLTGLFPSPAISLPKANMNPKSGESHWGYWTPKGNLRPIVAGSFKTSYPFQNFLPVAPPPNFDKVYPLSGVQALRITPPSDPAQNDQYRQPVDLNAYYHATINVKNGSTPSEQATFKVLIEPNTDQVQQVDVISPGKGYPTGNPPSIDDVELVIDDPIVPGGRKATARLQINGDGAVDAVFMTDKGSGYRHVIKVTKNPANPNEVDPPLILPNFQRVEEVMVGGQPVKYHIGLAEGLADVVSGGAGFIINDTQQPTVEIIGTGTGATAEILRAGQLISVDNPGIGFFTAQGAYPTTGDLVADAQNIQVHIPPATEGGPSPEAEVILATNDEVYQILTANPGSGFTDNAPNRTVVGSFKNKLGEDVMVDATIIGGKINNISRAPDQTVANNVNGPTPVNFLPEFSSAEATVYPLAFIQGVRVTDDKGVLYNEDVEVSFSGGAVGRPGFKMPVIDFHFDAQGQLVIDEVVDPGEGFYTGGSMIVYGGRGFNAALQPILTPDGRLVDVEVLRTGSRYLPGTRAVISGDPQEGKAGTRVYPQVDLVLEDGKIVDVVVTNQGLHMLNASVEIYGPGPAPDPIANSPKGKLQKIIFGPADPENFGGIVNPIPDPNSVGENYVPGISTQATVDSLPAYLHIEQTSFQMLSANQGGGFVTQSLPAEVEVHQVLFDSASALFSRYANFDQRPFGAGYATGSPDGYGLGNTFSSISKTVGLLFNLYQHELDEGPDAPKLVPSKYVIDAVNQPVVFDIYRENHPVVSLRGGLKTGVQGLQRALTLLFQDPPYQNSGTAEDNWQLSYFNQYDANVGRAVINPTAALPASGIASASMNPPAIPDAENQPKIDSGDSLRVWKPGLLFSGFGVSDQWNDQHYFYGYYLGAAGIAAVLEGAWLTDDELANLDPANAKWWSDEQFAGRAIDQWLQTFAYDSEIADAFYRQNGMNYQDFAFFDRYSGHPWATGSQPPDSVATFEDPVTNPWNDWRSWGIHNGIFGDENENSTWEGLQAFSAAVLWGAGTDRREIFDLGVYLLATGMSGSDFYFLDKNYNYKDSSQNQYSWTPTVSEVITDDAPAWKPTGGNNYAVGTGYVDSNPVGFYGEASAGASIIRKYGPTIDTFFYAYPTGPKFIEAYPPSPWNMGMARNSSYMQDWADVYTTEPWREARDSGLYQSAIWNSMAMTAAITGVPHAPGDSPGAADYVDRIWSGWYDRNGIAGDQVSKMPSENGLSIMNFLHVLQEYGTPDWTIYAKAVNSGGSPVDAILFTAAFSRPHPSQPNAIQTTLVAFNPGWETASVNFLPILADGVGTLGQTAINAAPIQVKPKRMIMQQVTRPIQ